jgi:thiol-disulfide isomerase/thioredoxin
VKIFKLYIVVLIVNLVVCCKNDTTTNLQILNSKSNNCITIILKSRTFKKDTIRNKGGAFSYKDNDIFYSESGNFIENIVPKNNFKKDDTLKIYTDKEIVFQHGFLYNYYTLYKFKPGDFIVFSYPNDYPICSIDKDKYSSDIVNTITNSTIKGGYVPNRSQFFMENKRIRTIQEDVIADEAYKKIIEYKLNSLKSIIKSDSSNVSFFNIYKRDLIYSNSLATSTILTQNIDLSIQTGRNLVVKTFNSSYSETLINQKKSIALDSRQHFDNVLKIVNITAQIKDYLMYYFMVDIILNYSKDDVKKYATLFTNNIANHKYVQVLEDRYLLNSIIMKKQVEKIQLLNSNKVNFELNELIKKKYKNKVVFVDFWASWCLPCRAAMPATVKLRNTFKNKDIIFVNISIDSDFDKWIAASKKEHLLKNADNYIASNYPTSNFYKELKIREIPRYVIFNKNGELVNKNASSPASENIVNEINDLLKK